MGILIVLLVGAAAIGPTMAFLVIRHDKRAQAAEFAADHAGIVARFDAAVKANNGVLPADAARWPVPHGEGPRCPQCSGVAARGHQTWCTYQFPTAVLVTGSGTQPTPPVR